MNSIEIPMIHYQIGCFVCNWVPMMYKELPCWKVEQGEGLPPYYIQIKDTPDFTSDFRDVEDFLLSAIYQKGFEVLLSMRDGQTVCMLLSLNERFEAHAPTPSLAIAYASLKAVGIECGDVNEKWIELYQNL